MACAEKELEETIVELGNRLLAPPSDVDELLRLLDKAESFLSRVEQSPSESMSAALHPAMKALIAKELLGHSDADVKVAVASCISEITRITAPEAPYNDDLMREIFQMIVKAFEKLDDISSRSYSKRVSILETVAKVRSCVVMLDLECDDLILEMFHHFLRTVRDDHPENVLSSMEVIMTLVLEESEDISPELLSRLLTNVKKDAMDILPVAKTLAEKVISNCAFKLKPCLMDVVQSLGVPLSDYSKIVATMCQENSDVLEHNGLNASGECVADDSKFSERTVSDELAQGSGKMESEVSCPEVGTASGRSPKSVMSNGIIQAGNDGSLAEPTSPNKKTELPKNASATRTEADKSDLIDVRDTSSDHSNKKSKGHKGNSAQLTNVNDNSQIVDEKGDTELPNRKKGNRKGPESSQSECPSSKEIEPATLKEDREVVEPQVASEKSKKDKASVVSPSSNEKLPDTSRPKRGRPAGAKGFTKKAGVGDAPVSPSGSHKAKAIEETDTEALLSFKKQKEGTKDLDTEPNRHSGKKQSARTVDDSGKGSYSNRKMEVDVGSDEERMHLRKRRKPGMELNEGDTSVKRQASKSKQQKIRDSSDNEMISSPRMAAKGDEDQVVLEETLKSKSGKKRAREEISKSPGVALKYDESLIGAKIKVWWPVDEKFYPGTVDSYNPVLKKHKVIYFDGDEEILLLKNEHFELIEDGEEEEENNDLAPEAASEMSRKKAKKLDSSPKKSKLPASSKSGNSAMKASVDRTESEAKSSGVATKSTSGRRGRPSKLGNKTDGSTPRGSKSKEKVNGKSSIDTPKAGSTLRNELNKSADGTPQSGSKSDGISKPGRKPKDDMQITGSRSKGDASRAGSKGKDAEPRSGNKLRSDTVKSGRKSKADNTTKAAQKPKSASKSDSGSKSDSVRNKSGSSRGQEAEDAAAKANSASRKSQEIEGRNGKKRKQKSQG